MFENLKLIKFPIAYIFSDGDNIFHFRAVTYDVDPFIIRQDQDFNQLAIEYMGVS